MPALTLILHNIRSSHNVGSIFRTSECAGIKKIFLTGYTPAPSDNFDRKNKEISKTALGAEKIVAWEKHEDIFELIKKLRATSCQLLALEQDEKSVDYREVKFSDKNSEVALILGNEVGGIEAEILALCDQIIEIPMKR